MHGSGIGIVSQARPTSAREGRVWVRVRVRVTLTLTLTLPSLAEVGLACETSIGIRPDPRAARLGLASPD